MIITAILIDELKLIEGQVHTLQVLFHLCEYRCGGHLGARVDSHLMTEPGKRAVQLHGKVVIVCMCNTRPVEINYNR